MNIIFRLSLGEIERKIAFMELYLIRHGEAEMGPPSEAGPPLSAQGMEDMEKVARYLDGQAPAPGQVLSSSLQRAIQTAEIFNKKWKLPINQVPWLRPGMEPLRILQELKKLPEERLALVGHLPALGWLLSVMVWGVPPKEISIPKGGVVLLEISQWEPAAGKIKWILNPNII